ncbi:MAG: hypothetical protein IT508_11765 [Burkholderiaceae bacterium]|nr:hypothetical protein [Burkholderiaceae bacterium]
MSLHQRSADVSPEQEVLNLRRQSPRALPTPPGLPRAWCADLGGLQGYAFPWGYVLEMPNGLKDPEKPRGDGITWRLLPTALLSEVRLRARETCWHWHSLLAHVNCLATAVLARYVPDWLVCRVTERYFLGELVAVGDRDARRARCWLAGRLLPEHIDAVLHGARDCLLTSIKDDFDVTPRSDMDEVSQ